MNGQFSFIWLLTRVRNFANFSHLFCHKTVKYLAIFYYKKNGKYEIVLQAFWYDSKVLQTIQIIVLSNDHPPTAFDEGC